MNEEVDIEILESYLQDRLRDEAKEQVENRLRTDEDFAALYSDVKILQEGIRESSRRRTASKLKKLEAEIAQHEKSGVKVIPINRTYWAIGAAASIVVLVSFFFLFRSTPLTPSEELFQTYFKPYTNITSPSTRGQTVVTPTTVAFQKYDAQEFDEAIELFEAIDQKDAALHLYLGNAYLATGNATSAVDNFKACMQKSDTFTKQAEWYLALSYLKNNETDKCISLLNKISDTSSYAPMARRILKELEKEKL